MKFLSIFKKTQGIHPGLDLQRKSSPGFTLIEFIVIMSIFSVMIGVVLFNFNGFKSNVTLENLAHDIAISIRQIQVSAGASRSLGNDPTEEARRGVHFMTDENGIYLKQFILFQDIDNNGYYNDSSEILDTILIQTPDRIDSIYYSYSMDEEFIPLDSPGDISITFQRYLTTAEFYPMAGDLPDGASIIQIKVASPDGELTRSVYVSKIGQVSIQ